jgi:RND family efflux transporter MFP subunit
MFFMPLPPRLRDACALGALVLATGHAFAAAADRPLTRVRVVTAKPSDIASDILLTGEIQPRIQSEISFRINGKIIQRLADTSQHIAADQVLARLDPHDQQSNVDNAQAAYNSADAQFQQARLTFNRQKTLIANGFTTRASFDSADQAMKTAEAAVHSAEASLNIAKEQLSYTDLRAGVDGTIVARNAEVGQVVQAGTSVFTVAEDGARDAVFELFESALAHPPSDRNVQIALQADPSVTAVGTVREISPSLDPKTGTIRVKVGIARTPARMTLGSTVIGRGRINVKAAFVLPWSALFEWNGKPAVWVLDAAQSTVTPKPVTIARYQTGSIVLSGGVATGDRVVAAGIQTLRPGQKVEVASEDAPQKPSGGIP